MNTRNEGTAAKSKTSYQNVPHAQLQNCTADTLSISPLTSASLLRGGGPWEAGWDLGGRLAAGEPNCPSSSSSSSIGMGLSTTQSFPDHHCLGNFSKLLFAQATPIAPNTHVFSAPSTFEHFYQGPKTRSRRAATVPPTPSQSRTKTIARTLTPARPRLLRFVQHMAGLGGPF